MQRNEPRSPKGDGWDMQGSAFRKWKKERIFHPTVSFLWRLLHNLFQLTFLAPSSFFLPISGGWKELQFPKLVCTLFSVIPRTERKRKIWSGSHTAFKRRWNPKFSKCLTDLQLRSEVRRLGHSIAKTSFSVFRNRFFRSRWQGAMKGAWWCPVYLLHLKDPLDKGWALQCVCGYVSVLWAFNTFKNVLFNRFLFRELPLTILSTWPCPFRSLCPIPLLYFPCSADHQVTLFCASICFFIIYLFYQTASSRRAGPLSVLLAALSTVSMEASGTQKVRNDCMWNKWVSWKKKTS